MSYQAVSFIIKPYHEAQAGYTIQTYEELNDVYLTDLPRIGESLSFNGKHYIVENVTYLGDIIEENQMKFMNFKKKILLKEKKPFTY